jgi:hypothetical protein
MGMHFCVRLNEHKLTRKEYTDEMVTVPKILHHLKEWDDYNELEGMWEDTVMIHFEVLS